MYTNMSDAARPDEPFGPPRFILDVGTAVRWLEAVLVATQEGTDLPDEFAGPTSSYLQIEAHTDPRHGDEDARTISDVIRGALELGIIAAPVETGITFITIPASAEEEALYRWEVQVFSASLTTQEIPLRVLGDGAALGVQACLLALKEAVDYGNGLLADLEAAAVPALARGSQDPVLLTRLAEHEEPLVRRLAAANPNCPDEGKVLGALREGNEPYPDVLY